MKPGQTIAELQGLLEGTSITALTLTTPDETITMRRRAGGSVPTPADRFAVRAACSGTFLHRHPLQQTPLAQIGQPVQAGTILGLLQVGTLLVHVVAPRDGIILAIAAANGEVVGYGTTLVQLITEGDA